MDLKHRSVKLNDGHFMPMLAFGTFASDDVSQTQGTRGQTALQGPSTCWVIGKDSCGLQFTTSDFVLSGMRSCWLWGVRGANSEGGLPLLLLLVLSLGLLNVYVMLTMYCKYFTCIIFFNSSTTGPGKCYDSSYFLLV